MSPEEIQQIFFVECEESLAAAEAGLAACQAGTQDADTVNAVFRAVHSIKGGAGAFGYGALQAYTHTFETLLSDVREGLVAIESGLIELLLRALDTLADHVEAARESGEAPDDAGLIREMEGAMAANANGAHTSPVEVVNEAEEPDEEISSDDDGGDDFGLDLDALLDDLTGGFAHQPSSGSDLDLSAGETAAWAIHVRPNAGAMRNGSEPLLMLRDLAELGGQCVMCDVSQIPPLDAFDPSQGYLGWTFAMPSEVAEDAVRDIFDFIGDDCALAIGNDAEIPPVEVVKLTKPASAPSATSPSTPAVASVVSAPAAKASAATDKGSATAPQGSASAAPADVDDGGKAPSSPTGAAPAAAGNQAPSGAPAGQSIRIDLFKLDRLIDLVGELVIAQAMLAQRLDDAGITATEELGLLERLDARHPGKRDVDPRTADWQRVQPCPTHPARFGFDHRQARQTRGVWRNHRTRQDCHRAPGRAAYSPYPQRGRSWHRKRRRSHCGRQVAGRHADSVRRTPLGPHPDLDRRRRRGHQPRARSGQGGGEGHRQRRCAALQRRNRQSDLRARLFHRTSVSNISGRGVGMDVVRQNVKDLGGRITDRERAR